MIRSAVTLLVALFPAVAGAATLHVGAGQPYTTISAAITAAAAGDTILVGPGTYNEYVNITKALTLAATNGSSVTHLRRPSGTQVVRVAASATVYGFDIDGAGVMRGIRAESTATDVVLDSLRIRNGLSDWGGGVEMLGESLTITGSRFEDNEATNSGGGLYMSGASVARNVTINTTTFLRNTAASYGGGLLSDSPLTMTGCVVQDNTAGYGAGIHLDFAHGGDVQDTRFYGNVATSTGGAFFVNDTSSTFTLAHDLFVDNEAPTGGAVYVGGGGYPGSGNTLRVLASTFVSNWSDDGSHLKSGSSYLTAVMANDVFAYGEGAGPGVSLYNATGARGYDLWFSNLGGDIVNASRGAGSLTADPKFVAWSDDGDPTNDDFSPGPGSPLVDHGHPAYQDADGTRSDIGWTGSVP